MEDPSKNPEPAPQITNDRLSNGLFEFDASNLVVIDEINEQIEQTSTVHKVSSDDDDIQFIEEVKATSTTTLKRTLNESSSSTEAKRQKVTEVERQVVEEVISQEQYLVQEPGNSSPDINEDEIHVLYTASEKRKTTVRNTRENLR